MKIFKSKKKKSYLRNIRQKKNKITSYIIRILIILAIFLSPVFYDSTKGNTDFLKTLNTYIYNINKNFGTIVNDIVTNFLPPDENISSNLTVHFIDVGQGDAELIQVNGKNFLIDTGGPEYRENLLNYLDSLNIKKIDVFLITHPHADHMGSAQSILERYRVDKVYMTNYVHTTELYKNFLLTVKEKGIKVIQARRGVTIDLGENADVKILAPDRKYTNMNSSSAVVKLVYGKTSFLFAGDATKETEKDILENEENNLRYLKVDVYKVAHHGSDTSSGSDFLNAIRPELSIVTVGKDNIYKLPNKAVVKRLKKINSIILTTRDNGTIKVFSDGKNISYQLKNGSIVKLYK
ncbi:ComEC/Rec2 family competence protein [Anaeromicropila herbilytica]|uniref:Metallo-beta-lactamase domain-containing protein n=1 Tax=Anaeromicropila herbilytica TaxID=2785025 RepID=A0A7R7ELX6_9FIRM|nr:MBL fold metallo-hydrolase [Anaeromicropila herbilytica]BCN31305.1 hypothetical protein bsdtb5_26000 [Anaeromicropila herbilytica]